MHSHRKKAMKITYISHSTIPSRYANSIQVMKMCQAFALLGHDVTLIAPHQKETEPLPPGNDIYSFYGVEPVFKITKLSRPATKRGNLVFGFLAALKALALKSDLVYGRNVTGVAFAAFLGKKVAYEAHQPLLKKNGRMAHMFLTKMMNSPNLKAVVCVSDALKREYQRLYGISGDALLVQRNGEDSPAELEAIEKVDLKAYPASKTQVGYVGHLYKGKGMELILVLAERCKDADFHIIGGSETDLANWKSKAEKIPNLHFHGFIPHGQLTGYYKAFDIVLAPYQHRVSPAGSTSDISQWMSPLKIFEYMAHGKAMICSDLPVLKEMLTHEQEALLCGPDDIAAWCHALDRLSKDTDLRTALGKNARSAFLKHYTLKSRAEYILDFTQRSHIKEPAH